MKNCTAQACVTSTVLFFYNKKARFATSCNRGREIIKMATFPAFGNNCPKHLQLVFSSLGPISFCYNVKQAVVIIRLCIALQQSIRKVKGNKLLLICLYITWPSHINIQHFIFFFTGGGSQNFLCCVHQLYQTARISFHFLRIIVKSI